MDAEQIARRRKLLTDKANALKDLHILGDLDAEEGPCPHVVDTGFVVMRLRAA